MRVATGSRECGDVMNQISFDALTSIFNAEVREQPFVSERPNFNVVFQGPCWIFARAIVEC